MVVIEWEAPDVSTLGALPTPEERKPARTAAAFEAVAGSFVTTGSVFLSRYDRDPIDASIQATLEGRTTIATTDLLLRDGDVVYLAKPGREPRPYRISELGYRPGANDDDDLRVGKLAEVVL